MELATAAETASRACTGCGTSIAGRRGRAIWCESCAAGRRRERSKVKCANFWRKRKPVREMEKSLVREWIEDVAAGIDRPHPLEDLPHGLGSLSDDEKADLVEQSRKLSRVGMLEALNGIWAMEKATHGDG